MKRGLRRSLAAHYVVITVDRMLPAIDGIPIIRLLRKEGMSTLALIPSALGEIADYIRGLRGGGDVKSCKAVRVSGYVGTN